MGKVNLNSRDNWLTTNGVLDLIDSWTDQSVTTTSSPTFNSVSVTDAVIVGGDLDVVGNLTVGGSTTVISTDIVEIKDNIVELNSTEVGAGVTLGAAGIEINRGSLLSYRIVFDEASDDTKIGEIGSLQSVATREDSPLNSGIMVYNSALKRLDSTQNIQLSTSFLSSEASVTSGTGALRVSGGLGVVGRMSIDSAVYFKGNGYVNYIDADSTDTMAIVANNNITLVVPSAKTVSIPQNSYFAYDGGTGVKKIYATPTLLNVENSNGDITFLTNSGGSLNVPDNTYLNWGTGNRIRYDSSNITLESSGQFRVSPVLNNLNTTASTNNLTGSIITGGGIASSNTTEATNSTNGGSFTTGGGAAIQKSLFIGNKLTVSDLPISIVQETNRGINIRSVSRTLTTTSSNSTAFNSFEGGIISSALTIPLASTMYITSPPSIIGGGSITNSYSLYVASGKSYFEGDITLNDTTASTSTTTGALKLVGGISIANSTNSSSYANGGTITTGGGIGVGGDIYTAGKVDLGAVGLTATQVSGQGVNFRSRDRVLTTISTNNTVFNSFEGGSISSVATIPQASTVYINGSPSISGGGTITNPYSLYINSGILYSGDTTASASSTTASIITEGGISIKNSTNSASFTNGGSFTTAGGMAIAKNLYTGGNSLVGTGNPIVGERSLVIENTSSNSASYSILRVKNDDPLNNCVFFLNSSTRTDDGGVNNATFRNDAGELNLQSQSFIGLNISTTGVVTSQNTTASTSNSTGGFRTLGGIGISNATNATNSTNGGSFTTAGGMGIEKDVYIGGLLDVNGVANLDQTNINTTDGAFSVTGTNGANINVGSTSSFTTTSGSITVDSQAGSLILDGHSGVTIDSATSGISIDVSGTSNFTTTSGILNFSAPDINITSTSGALGINTTAGINIETTSSTINIGVANPTIPIFIGNTVSEVTINDNLTVLGDLFVTGTTTTTNTIVSTTGNNAIIVNFSPVGTSDGGLVMRRYQTPNDGATGDVIQDTPKESSTFGANSSGNDLTLNAGASSINDYYMGWWILVTSGAGQFQARRILTYDGTTKVATIYATADNNPPIIVDGLDLTTPVLSGDSYELFDGPYQGVFYDESLDVFKFAAVASAPESGEFPTTTSLSPLLLKQIYVEDPFPEFDGVIVDYTNAEALLVRKNTDGGDVFTVNTLDGEITMANPVNTVSSSVDLFLKGLDNINAVQTYSSIVSTITDNISGNLKSTLSFSVQNDTEGLVSFLELKGGVSGSSFVDVLSSVDSLRILNTSSTTSSTTGVLRLSGGLGINLATDATSSTNGGSLTTSGGAAVALKLYVGGTGQFVSNTNISNTLNSLTGTEGSINVNGDLALYNSTSNKIIFNNVGSAAPTFTARSDGTKIVLKGEISGSSGDFALGINGDNLWYSTPTTSDSHIFYTGTTNVFNITSNGISTLQAGASINLYNGVNTAQIKETSDSTYFIPHDSTITKGFIYRDSSNSNSRIRINSDGQLTLGLTGYSGAPGGGHFLNILSQTFTDNTTAASGTTAANAFNTVSQPTLAATNASVTTTAASNLYIGGPPVRGTNQTLTNAYGMYIDSGTELTSTGIIDSAASLYIKDSPTAGGTGVITNSYALLVDSGTSRFDGKVILPTTSLQVSDTTNTLTDNPGSMNIFGDLVLQNSTRQGIYFNANGSAIPTYTNRSVGTKLILNPQISGSSIDYSIGVSSSAIWYGVPTTSQTHDFYFGTLLASSMTSTGLLFNTASSALISPNTSDTTDNKGIVITGGGSTGITRGAQIEVYGNELNSGNLELKSGGSGEINLSTAGSERLTILNNGNISISSTTDTTGTGTGSIYTAGGMNVDLSLFVGTTLTLDFNQQYEFTGDASGRLNIGTKTSGIASTIRYFTNDGDNSDNNLIEIFGLGTKSSLTNTEYLRIGYASSSTEYTINTGASGSGTVRTLSFNVGSNVDQMKLLTNGNVTLSSTTTSTSTTTGALRLSGGIGISNATNSTSSTNGGSFTTAGGMAAAGTVYIGEGLFIGESAVVGERSLRIKNSNSGTSSYAMLRLANDTANNLVMFLNSSASTTGDGAANGAVIRNDSGELNLQGSSGVGLNISSTGIVTGTNTVASSSATTGAFKLVGGFAISNTTNATSSTNGGSFTTAGGMAVAQDLYVGGNIVVSGTVGITNPSLTFSNLVNITGSVTTSNSVNSQNGTYRTFSIVFISTPTASNVKTSFEFVLPERSTNFTNVYDITVNTSGYYNTTAPESIENSIGFAVISTTRGKIQFTSSSTDTHIIQAIIRYTAI